MAGHLGCALSVAEGLARVATLRRLQRHGIFIFQGDEESGILLLLVGRARAHLLSSDGRQYRLCDYYPGDLFGAIDGAAAHAHEVAAIEPSEAADFRQIDFFYYAERHASIALALSRSLLRQVSELASTLGARLSLSAMGRVYSELLALFDAAPDHCLSPVPVISDIATRAQTTRETASRALSGLERRGIVRRERNRLVMTARARLAGMIV